jgi:hypothetical protein
MDPSMLDDRALEYELKIRGLTFENTRNAKKILNEALQKEKGNSTIGPTLVTTELEWEIADLCESFWLRVEEYATLSNFKYKLNIDCINQVYAILRHVEGRCSRIVREAIGEAKTRKLLDELEMKLKKFRRQHFSDREPFIVLPEKEVDKVASEAFSNDELKELRDLEKRIEELKNKESRCVRFEIDYSKIIVEECDEENKEVDEQVKIDKQKVETDSQPMRSSCSDVIFGSHPPGHSNSGQNFVPRIPVPLFPSQPVPLSSANVYVGGDFWARQHRKSASLSTTLNQERNVGTQRRNNESFVRAIKVNADQLWSDGFVRRSNEVCETWKKKKKKHDAVVKKQPFDESWMSDWHPDQTAVEAMQWLGYGSGDFDCENAKIR